MENYNALKNNILPFSLRERGRGLRWITTSVIWGVFLAADVLGIIKFGITRVIDSTQGNFFSYNLNRLSTVFN